MYFDPDATEPIPMSEVKVLEIDAQRETSRRSSTLTEDQGPAPHRGNVWEYRALDRVQEMDDAIGKYFAIAKLRGGPSAQIQ